MPLRTEAICGLKENLPVSVPIDFNNIQETKMFRITLKTLMAGMILLCSTTLPVQSVQADTIERTSNFNTKKVVKKRIRHTSKRRARRGYSKARPSIVAAVRRHARAAGVPVRVGLAVVRQESNFRPGVTGRAGEIGLMQLKCSTARGMGYRGSCRGLYKVSTNLKYGMKYLRKALRRGSVAYYNAGLGAKRLPRAARKYARQVSRRI